MVACMALVLFFQTSGDLAAAFGIAVTGDRTVTTLIFVIMVILRWKWSALIAVQSSSLCHREYGQIQKRWLGRAVLLV